MRLDWMKSRSRAGLIVVHQHHMGNVTKVSSGLVAVELNKSTWGRLGKNILAFLPQIWENEEDNRLLCISSFLFVRTPCHLPFLLLFTVCFTIFPLILEAVRALMTMMTNAVDLFCLRHVYTEQKQEAWACDRNRTWTNSSFLCVSKTLAFSRKLWDELSKHTFLKLL